MIPVMRMRIGATDAESTPPAANSDQKMGSCDRFMSQPPYQEVDQDGSAYRRQPAAGRNDEVRKGPAGDADIRGGLGRNLPPGVGVVADREQRHPVKNDRDWADQRRAPALVGALALREPEQAHEQDDRIDREEDAARFPDHVAHEEGVSAPPTPHWADISPNLRHQPPPLGMRSFLTPK